MLKDKAEELASDYNSQLAKAKRALDSFQAQVKEREKEAATVTMSGAFLQVKKEDFIILYQRVTEEELTNTTKRKKRSNKTHKLAKFPHLM